MKYKITATQVPPEQQEMPFNSFEELDYTKGDNLAIFGNRNYKDYLDGLIGEVVACCDECLNDISAAETSEEIIETIKYYFYDVSFPEDYFTDEKVNEWKTFADSEYTYKELHDFKAICQILTLLTGNEYDYIIIRGNCQGEWNYIVYNTRFYSDENIQQIEIAYFNKGTEYIVDIEEVDKSKTEIDSVCVYVYNPYNEEKVKEEILEGVEIDEKDAASFELKAFDGYKQTPIYKSITLI